MDAEDHGLIQQNAERFNVANVNAVLGRAPEIFDELPDPDCVFVAGAGREVTRISQAAYTRLRPRGRLVVNTTSIDHLMELREALRLPFSPGESRKSSPSLSLEEGRKSSLPLPLGEGQGEGALNPLDPRPSTLVRISPQPQPQPPPAPPPTSG